MGVVFGAMKKVGQTQDGTTFLNITRTFKRYLLHRSLEPCLSFGCGSIMPRKRATRDFRGSAQRPAVRVMIHEYVSCMLRVGWMERQPYKGRNEAPYRRYRI